MGIHPEVTNAVWEQNWGKAVEELLLVPTLNYVGTEVTKRGQVKQQSYGGCKNPESRPAWLWDLRTEGTSGAWFPEGVKQTGGHQNTVTAEGQLPPWAGTEGCRVRLWWKFLDPTWPSWERFGTGFPETLSVDSEDDISPTGKPAKMDTEGLKRPYCHIPFLPWLSCVTMGDAGLLSAPLHTRVLNEGCGMKIMMVLLQKHPMST